MMVLLLLTACCVIPVREPWTPPAWPDGPVDPIQTRPSAADTGLPGDGATLLDGEPYRIEWLGATVLLLEHGNWMTHGIPENEGHLRVTWDDGEVVEYRGYSVGVRSRGMAFFIDCADIDCLLELRSTESGSRPVPWRDPRLLIETDRARYDPFDDCPGQLPPPRR